MIRCYKIIKIFLIKSILCLCFITSLAQGPQEQRSLIYENEAMGIKLTGPQGWSLVPGEQVQKAVSKGIGEITNLESIKESVEKLGILVAFTQQPFGSPIEYNPTIILSTESLSPEYNIKTPLDAALASVLAVKTMFKDVKIIKEPVSVTKGSIEGANFVYEGTIVRGYLETKVKSSTYIFIKDNLIYTLSFNDKADNFDNNSAAFESSYNSFVIK